MENAMVLTEIKGKTLEPIEAVGTIDTLSVFTISIGVNSETIRD